MESTESKTTLNEDSEIHIHIEDLQYMWLTFDTSIP